MSTPHISAPPGAFAETVLLPGDPARAKHVAETLLEDAVQVTAVRNMLGYTGTWKGRRVSVMGTGMGIPSCSIYASELVREYGVRRLVRVGTCGGVADALRLGDLVVALGAGTDSNANRLRFGGHDFAATADFGLLRAVVDAGAAAGVPLHVGNVFSTDLFYHPQADLVGLLARFGVLGVEMEAAGLYGVAAAHGVQALAVLAVSDHLRRDERMTAERREAGLDAMFRLVLDALA
jgi:purine-nucleoside phosphorylase